MSKKEEKTKLEYNVVYEKVYGKVYGKSYRGINIKKMEKLYSIPKIYTGGVDVTKWKKLSNEEKELALSKNWYVYFSFRHPITGKLKRQNPIKAGNQFKDLRNRIQILKLIKRSLLEALENGFNPYDDGEREEQSNINSNNGAKQAIEYALSLKKEELAATSYSRYEPRIKDFLVYLEKEGYAYRDIKLVNKRVVTKYLDIILKQSSSRNRNNARADLSSLFTKLKQRDYINDNFIKSEIEILDSNPERNKTYSIQLLEDIETYLEKNDPNLLLFTRFVCYTFLRPIEVCRLKVKDINIKEKSLTVRTKNKPLKTKIIPDLLFKELPNIKKHKREEFLFTPNGVPGVWNATEDSKRDYFTSRFKKVKEHFDLNKDYGIYSFRHTYITQLYRSRRKEGQTPNEVKSWLMLITGHTTLHALSKYLRDIDAELPEEYSQYLKRK